MDQADDHLASVGVAHRADPGLVAVVPPYQRIDGFLGEGEGVTGSVTGQLEGAASLSRTSLS